VGAMRECKIKILQHLFVDRITPVSLPLSYPNCHTPCSHVVGCGHSS